MLFRSEPDVCFLESVIQNVDFQRFSFLFSDLIFIEHVFILTLHYYFILLCISLLGSVVWAHHMYTVGLETDTRAYFSGVTILISLPTGTKIFNWKSTYLGNPALLLLKTNSPFFGLLFLLMFTIGGSTGIILGNAGVDLGLHDTRANTTGILHLLVLYSFIKDFQRLQHISS